MQSKQTSLNSFLRPGEAKADVEEDEDEEQEEERKVYYSEFHFWAGNPAGIGFFSGRHV